MYKILYKGLVLDQWFLTFISLPNPYVILHDFVVVNGDNYGLKRFFFIFLVMDLLYLYCWTLTFFFFFLVFDLLFFFPSLTFLVFAFSCFWFVSFFTL